MQDTVVVVVMDMVVDMVVVVDAVATVVVIVAMQQPVRPSALKEETGTEEAPYRCS